MSKNRKALKMLTVRNRDHWRNWLAAHHGSDTGIWLVFHKGRARPAPMTYDDAVEEALCFGWIDSIIKRIDDARYVRKFTPRKPDSKWSASNRRRYAELLARGLLAAPGVARSPTARSYTIPPKPQAIPRYIQKAIESDVAAWKYFERLAPAYRRAYAGWIDSAKQQETKARRLREVIGVLRAGKKLGLK